MAASTGGGGASNRPAATDVNGFRRRTRITGTCMLICPESHMQECHLEDAPGDPPAQTFQSRRDNRSSLDLAWTPSALCVLKSSEKVSNITESAL